MKEIDEGVASLKVMPCNIEAEHGILGCILVGKDIEMEIAMAWIRNDDAFYSKDALNTFKAMKELYKNKVPIDVITVGDKMFESTGEKDTIYLLDLQVFCFFRNLKTLFF